MASEGKSGLMDNPHNNIPEIDRPNKIPTAKNVPGAEKTGRRVYNYWAKDTLLDPTSPVHISDPAVQKVVERLDAQGDNPSSDLLEKYAEKLLDLKDAPPVGATPTFGADIDRAIEVLNLKKTERSGGGLTPEFPKTSEEYAEIVRNAVVDFVDTDVLENITHGWQNKIVVTRGGLMKYTLGDKAIESDPVIRTPITLRDSKGNALETIPLYEYLRREVDAAEAFTLTAYAWKTCNVKDKVANVVGIDIPNKGLDALGKVLTADLKTNIGDMVGEIFSVYCRMAKGDATLGLGGNTNFFRERGVPREIERKTREYVRANYLGGLSKTDQVYIESLALNLSYAWGYSSEGSSTGTMSATERATYLDRVFKTNVWRDVKKHSGGPRSTIGSDIYPDQLLMPSPELFTITEKESGVEVYRTLDSKLKEFGYKFRDVNFLSIPEIDKRFDVFVLDACAYFEDIILSPSEIKAEWKGFHKIAEHAENALNPALVMAQIEGSNVDGLKKTDVDKLVEKRQKELTIETFRGLREEAKRARMWSVAGEIQIVCKNVTGKTL